MAAGFEFKMEGLEELQRDLEKAVKRAPVQAGETLEEIAKDFKADAKRRANAELKPHDREGAQKRKAIKKKWGHRLIGDRLGAAALVWNSARHFHLIENGHNLVRNGQTIGFVEGKHIMEKTRKAYEDVVPERFEKMADDILKRSGLD